MKIVIIGAGKLGALLAELLCQESHDVTLIDQREDLLRPLGEQLDIMTVSGNASTYAVQTEAGVDSADLVIAATSTDELNLLCCLIAKKLGAKNTIARVRNPAYSREISLIQEDLGLSMSVNPDMLTAMEISRILRLPAASKIDTFAKGQVELLKIRVPAHSILDGTALMDLSRKGLNVLICAVERGEKDVFIPTGAFRLQAGDWISVVAKARDAIRFVKQIGIPSSPVKKVLLIGGGRISIYLARIMLEYGADVKIIEAKAEVCERLAEQLPKATIIHGDGTDQSVLAEEGIHEADAVLPLTGLDEENIIMALYAARVCQGKIIAKINRRPLQELTGSLGLASVFNPSRVAAGVICRYVRALENSVGSNVEALSDIAGGKAEALEFRVTEDSQICHIPLQQLRLKPNLLIGCINRDGRIIAPRGSDTIEPGDTVVVVTTNTGLNDLADILEKRRG